MPKSDVSDVDDDELAKMLEGIDFSDDDQTAKQKLAKPKVSDTPAKYVGSKELKTTPNQSEPPQDKSKVMRDLFGLDSKRAKPTKPEPQPPPKEVEASALLPPTSKLAMERPTSGRRRNPNPVTFDDDDTDDLLGDMGSKKTPPKPAPKAAATKPSSSFMDDLFGKAETPKEVVKAEPKKDFVLDTKYKGSIDPKQAPGPKGKTIGAYDPTPAKTEGPAVGGGGRRRRGETLAPTNPPPDLDEDLLFRGTSLAPKQSLEPAPLPAPPPHQPPPQPTWTGGAPAQPQAPWTGGPTAQPQPPAQQPLPPWMSGPVAPSTIPESHPPAAPNAAAAPPWTQPVPSQPVGPSPEMSAANQQIIEAYQRQLQQMQDLERQQQDQFQRDLEEQRRLLQGRQNEHKTILEQQRTMCQDQVVAMQEKQRSILKQQQAQTEILMKQIQTQMESELRIKSDLVRNQVQILSELQMQNPEQVIDLASLVDRIKDAKPLVGLEPKTTRETETWEEMEQYFRQREERIRQTHSEEMEDLEKRITDLMGKAKQDHEAYKADLEQERQRRRQMLQDQADEHQEAFQMLKSEYTIAVDRIRELKALEMEAQLDAERSSKSVQSLLNQVTSNTQDLDHLHEKVEDKLARHIDVREELLKQKDSQIAGLQAKIQQKSQELSDEQRLYREKMNKLVEETDERESELAQKRTHLDRSLLELENDRLKFETTREIDRKRLNEEKRKVQDQRLLIDTERRNFQRIILEESEHMATTKARAFIEQRLHQSPSSEKGAFDTLMGQHHFNEDIIESYKQGPLRGEKVHTNLERSSTESEREMDLRGLINALAEAKTQNDRHKSKIQENKKSLKDEWQRVREERQTILAAVKKLGEAEKKFALKLQEIEEITQSCVQLRLESRSCLETAQQLSEERSEAKRALHHQLDLIQRKEAQLEDTRRKLIQERQRLWNTRSSILCSQCQSELTHGLHEPENPALLRAKRTAGDGQLSGASQMASLRKEAELDQMYLAQESQYLRSLQQEA